jgi:ribosomal protein S18
MANLSLLITITLEMIGSVTFAVRCHAGTDLLPDALHNTNHSRYPVVGALQRRRFMNMSSFLHRCTIRSVVGQSIASLRPSLRRIPRSFCVPSKSWSHSPPTADVPQNLAVSWTRATQRAREFSSGRGSRFGDDDDDLETIKAAKAAAAAAARTESPTLWPPTDDPFGINYDDGKGGLGPNLPPLYQRDSTTGRFTGEIVAELSEKDKQVLAADQLEQDAMLLDRIEAHWTKKSDTGDISSGSRSSTTGGIPTELVRLGARIRLSDMATNVLGRSPKAQATAELLDDGSELGRDSTAFSQHLTRGEFKTFTEYMQQKYHIEVSPDDIPVQEAPSPKSRQATAMGDDPEHADWSLKWLSARAQRQMDDSLDDNPYSDLMPGDLSPNRVVNRKRAKQIPPALLHHNNLALLQNFVSPSGQIRNRMQTRLGARDQRRVARLIKRSRALGLIPFMGQFKAEQHGWVNAPDIRQDRQWERDLVQRGLVLKKFTPKNPPE